MGGGSRDLSTSWFLDQCLLRLVTYIRMRADMYYKDFANFQEVSSSSEPCIDNFEQE
jgi:hypothetical protein